MATKKGMGQMKRKILVVLGLVAFLGVGLTTYATAADEGTVNATVTASIIAITLDETDAAYGVVTVGSTGNVPSPSSFIATNAGTVNEDFNIKGANTANWTLVGTAPGTDEYQHRVSMDAFSSEQDLTDTFVTLVGATGVTPSGTETISMVLDAPSSTAITAEQTAPIVVQAVTAV